MESKQALFELLNGTTLVASDRYYRYFLDENEIRYSDDKENWKPSKISLNELLKWDNWQKTEL